MELSDKILLVTGGNGSLGKIINQSFASYAKHIVSVDQLVAEDAIQSNRNISYYQCDLTDPQACASTFDEITNTLGIPQVLINNAGKITNEPLINLLKPERKHSFANWQNTITANLTTTFNATSNFVDHLVTARRQGVIINITSVCAQGNAGQSAYSAAKAGVNALTKVWSKELAAMNIRVVSLAPGFIDSESTHQALTSRQIETIKERIASKRLAKSSEFISAIQFIIENDYLNGIILPLDGGINF